MMESLKAKTEIIMNWHRDKIFDNCPECGEECIKTFQISALNYDDSNPVRMCQKCDIAWIWPYPRAN